MVKSNAWRLSVCASRSWQISFSVLEALDIEDLSADLLDQLLPRFVVAGVGGFAEQDASAEGHQLNRLTAISDRFIRGRISVGGVLKSSTVAAVTGDVGDASHRLVRFLVVEGAFFTRGLVDAPSDEIHSVRELPQREFFGFFRLL
jgi:hypothetical protein